MAGTAGKEIELSAMGLLHFLGECLKTAEKYLICEVKFSGKRHCHVKMMIYI
jgi:hypothetical protein